MSETQLATVPEKKPIVSADSRGVQFSSLDEMYRFSVAVVKSKMVKGFETPEAAMIAIQMGLELGVSPMQALSGIAVINGRATVYGDLALALCSSHPDFVDIHEDISDTSATCTVKRKDRSDVKRTFTVDDAKKAALWGKSGPWTNYPKRMLQMRARAFALRDSFPDKLKGIGIREEQEDIQPKPVKATVIEPDIDFGDATKETAPEARVEPKKELTEEAIPEGWDPVTKEFKF